MVKGLKGSDLPEPWFGKKSKALTEEKRTKPTSRGMPAEPALEAETEGQCMNIGKGRGKVKKKENPAGKGKNNMKLGRSAPTNVLLGRTKNPVADPTELRRKRIEDAIACGRVVKTIVNPAKRRSCPRTGDTERAEHNAEDGLAAAFNEIGSGSPTAIEKIALPGGKRAGVMIFVYNPVYYVLYRVFYYMQNIIRIIECNVGKGAMYKSSQNDDKS